MKPSQHRPQQKPRRMPSAESVDRMAADLAADMLAFMSTRYENASEDERLELIMRYAPTLHALQQTVSRAARAQQRQRRRSYPGHVETK